MNEDLPYPSDGAFECVPLPLLAMRGNLLEVLRELDAAHKALFELVTAVRCVIPSVAVFPTSAEAAMQELDRAVWDAEKLLADAAEE